jgi:hypothetical protein
MLSLPDIKTANDVTARIREIVRYLRHSSKETALVFTALFAGVLAFWLLQFDGSKQFPEFISKENWQKFSNYASLALFVLSGLLIGWAYLRVWRQIISPPESQYAVRPTALKGPMAFGPQDAELFRRLGRQVETRTLLDWILNDQIGLIVIKGDSGAGKTSLLRAGLPDLLAKQSPPIEYHYWEAIPDRADTGLLNAVKAGWTATPDAPIPQKLSELDTLGLSNGHRVVVLDQFEQLLPTKSAHQPIFQLLQNAAVTAMPPHRITFIVAFRADYASTWFDFQYDQLASGSNLTLGALVRQRR